jgi:hypothetical protein
MARTILSRLSSSAGVACVLFIAPLVAAQTAPAPAPAPAPTQPPPPPVTPAPPPVAPAPAAPAPAPTPAPAPEPATAPAAPAIPAPSPEPAPAEPAPTPLPEPMLRGVAPDIEALPWYDAIEFRGFVDGYLSLNWRFPKPQGGANSVTRAYDTSNGFALSWAGIDATYPAEPVGGTLSLRFGPTAERIAGGCISGTCDAAVGLSNVKQAFASWRPWSAVQLDFGKFDTIYGAEVAESQDNLNYTRGIVYWFTQPLFHTGLRVSAELTEALTLRALLVNGTNNTIDNNVGKDLGLQLALNVPRSGDGGTLLAASLGYLVGPEQDDLAFVECDPATQYFDPAAPSGCAEGNGGATSGVVDRASSNTEGLRHLIDLVATFTPIDPLTLQLNFDLDIERVRDAADAGRFIQHTWWGVMLGARYAFVDEFAVAVRGEYLDDPDAYGTGIAKLYPPLTETDKPVTDMKMVTGTLTLDYRPADYLILRLDNRIDWASKEIFPVSVRELAGGMMTSTLGVVVTTH